jgi:NAD(P)-dependent dehydrogenase (short-subunit alcohol dehydrogenase family)
MNTGLAGRVAVVTGGSRGIGRAVAKRLLEEGACVMIVARKPESIDATCRELGERIAGHATNVADETGARAAIDATIDRFGRLDVLVNNASTNPYFGPLMKIDRERADRTVQVNQWGTVLWTQLAWKAWMAEHGGRVVNISSMGGLLPEPNIGWYNGTKAAIIQLTRQMAQELGPKVTVNCVAPGVIRTDMSKAIWERHEQAISAHVPALRLGEPDDIADAVVFFASDQARYVTGQTLVVDGGLTLGHGVVPT